MIAIDIETGRGYIPPYILAYLDHGIGVYIEIMSERFKVLGYNHDLQAYHVERVERHVFDPGGRTHWDMPRCSLPICREMEDHPNHITQEALDDRNRSAGRDDPSGVDADVPGSGSGS